MVQDVIQQLINNQNSLVKNLNETRMILSYVLTKVDFDDKEYLEHVKSVEENKPRIIR